MSAKKESKKLEEEEQSENDLDFVPNDAEEDIVAGAKADYVLRSRSLDEESTKDNLSFPVIPKELFDPSAKKVATLQIFKSNPDLQELNCEALVDLVGCKGHPQAVHKEKMKIYDDCDEVRRKIGVVITSKALHDKHIEEITSCSNEDIYQFLRMRGCEVGHDSPVYTAAYYFFEKLREKLNIDKSPQRMQVENDHPSGFNVETPQLKRIKTY